MVIRAIALMVLAVGLAAPAYADTTDDAFIPGCLGLGETSFPGVVGESDCAAAQSAQDASPIGPA